MRNHCHHYNNIIINIIIIIAYVSNFLFFATYKVHYLKFSWVILSNLILYILLSYIKCLLLQFDLFLLLWIKNSKRAFKWKHFFTKVSTSFYFEHLKKDIWRCSKSSLHAWMGRFELHFYKFKSYTLTHFIAVHIV